jgi:hypothetical protein
VPIVIRKSGKGNEAEGAGSAQIGVGGNGGTISGQRADELRNIT